MSHAPILYLEPFSSGTRLNLYNHFDHNPKAARVNNLAAWITPEQAETRVQFPDTTAIQAYDPSAVE